VRVLVVEEEVRLASLLRRALRHEGFAAEVAVRGEDALWMAADARYDAIVLDAMRPGIDGFKTCRRLREAEIWTPVLSLTAHDARHDRATWLDGGADDYLIKPFQLAELLARLRALVRRAPVRRSAVLEVGDLRLDPATRQVWRHGTLVALHAKSLAVLAEFMRRPGVALSRDELLEAAWDGDYDNRSNVVDQQVRALRQRIDRPFGRDTIETVRGVGYRLREDGRH
jgi:two-component system OmpR family response regulator